MQKFRKIFETFMVSTTTAGHQVIFKKTSIRLSKIMQTLHLMRTSYNLLVLLQRSPGRHSVLTIYTGWAQPHRTTNISVIPRPTCCISPLTSNMHFLSRLTPHPLAIYNMENLSSCHRPLLHGRLASVNSLHLGKLLYASAPT